MCKKGDIILVHNYVHGDSVLSAHPFVVIGDKGGKVCGFDFDMICVVMSSFKDDAQKAEKLSHPSNFPVSAEAKTITGTENKDAYIKAEQFYFFTKSCLEYVRIGCLDAEAWDALRKFILSLPEKGIPIEHVIDNLM